jgi:hypothetical protein
MLASARLPLVLTPPSPELTLSFPYSFPFHRPKTPSHSLSPARTRSAAPRNVSARRAQGAQSLSTRSVWRGWLIALHI